ncbi:Sua5/YciO/YrdC/YwlC family protein [Lacimicrobium alkaliphilum]|uniref:Threonylcarbamoyl-AMP synthase n=1 Tax=Lacimicrobium alkaliphilum TaxID=1526571 RepID=A0ABQ1RJ09_9ALTE|nr:Sua5/YciO/YrdC/YwlC family protein [Lacimicrobium alkaliphilum]GGD72089.1 threonylcarbamoyl-AMP synthase [Lacimicrobium alkaliphilum]
MNESHIHWHEETRQAFSEGKLLAYPTEAVFGLGCDPDNQYAVMSLLALKQRPLERGLILVAKTYSQLLPYVKDSAIPLDRRTGIISSWPGPVTWLLPKSDSAPDWITGGNDMIAVRVSAHPVVAQLCELFDKPLVSTSANLTGQRPVTEASEIVHTFADKVLLVPGELGGSLKPSEIRHGLTGKIIRPGK